MANPFDAESSAVPSIGRSELVVVDGRTFAISDDSGQIRSGTHGLVHDDLRHVSRLEIAFVGARLEVLAASTPTPLSAVVVGRLLDDHNASLGTIVTRRRWIAGGLRDDVHVHNTTAASQAYEVRAVVEGDFAHVFDVKSGLSGTPQQLVRDGDVWHIVAEGVDAHTTVCFDPRPEGSSPDGASVAWALTIPPRTEVVVTLTAEPVVDGAPAGLAFPIGLVPTEAIPMRRIRSWNESVPHVVSSDARLAPAVAQSLADIAALRIVDAAHPERSTIAAGAPWFMTLFGRDSLLSAWMALPFEPNLACGVLATLADLRGRRTDDDAEEQPGKILHELRRHGGGGPFATRTRYFGTVDATPLFVMLAAEAQRWGALSIAQLDSLAPAIDDAVEWLIRDGDSDGDGFVDYRRRRSTGLSNQGWKDSWDGVAFADGSLPESPIALAEVQGYCYAAFVGAAELGAHLALTRPADELLERADRLRTQFNERFWNPRGWFSIGLDREGRQIDALTTNPGHALWTGIAEPALARQQLDRFCESAMWTGWGLRTLADTMAAYDPLSYHNGSVWPHDTAICAAGAARYGRWDVVDQIVDGALDAAEHFGGRPPELFAGISRTDAPMPVAYPASCSPQAWASASILSLVRTLLDLDPSADGAEPVVRRVELSSVPDLRITHLHVGGRTFCVAVDDGVASVIPEPPQTSV